MTNREWLATLSDNDFVNWLTAEKTSAYFIGNDGKVHWVIKPATYSPCYKEVVGGYTSADARLREWIKEERKEATNDDEIH